MNEFSLSINVNGKRASERKENSNEFNLLLVRSSLNFFSFASIHCYISSMNGRECAREEKRGRKTFWCHKTCRARWVKQFHEWKLFFRFSIHGKYFSMLHRLLTKIPQSCWCSSTHINSGDMSEASIKLSLCHLGNIVWRHGRVRSVRDTWLKLIRTAIVGAQN